jgi:hypothetical protein
MIELLIIANILLLGAVVALGARYLSLLHHGYSVSLYRPN